MAFVPLPAFAGADRSTYINCWTFGVTSTSKKKEAAAELLAWIADPALEREVLLDPKENDVVSLQRSMLRDPAVNARFGGIPIYAADALQKTRAITFVDGAPGWRVALEVTLPQLKGVIAVVAILKTVFALKMFDQVATLTGGGPGSATQTLAYLVYTVAFRWYGMGYASAIAWMLTVVLILLAVLYARLLFAKAR